VPLTAGCDLRRKSCKQEGAGDRASRLPTFREPRVIEVQRRQSPPPDRLLRTPALQLPAGACDTHVHIFGPQARFPLLPGRRLDVEDCTLDDLIALQTALGLSRALLVQSFQHGHSYEYMLHALGAAPDRFRGVAAPAADVTDLELDLLERAGVVGARFAYMASPVIDARLLVRIADRRWQAHFMVEGPEQIAAWRDVILSYPHPFVIEHMGMPPAERGVESPEFRFVLECLETGRCWVKLSPRFSREPLLPFADVLPFVHALVQRAPRRLLWGSDWPHPNYFEPMPNDADLVDLLATWIPDAAVLQRVMVDNPAELFGF
jgi:2-pyrone-4,6-dicarboxylate lactonase